MISPNLPLIDLHRHLDGSVRLETILELGQHYNLPLPADNIEDLRPFVAAEFVDAVFADQPIDNENNNP